MVTGIGLVGVDILLLNGSATTPLCPFPVTCRSGVWPDISLGDNEGAGEMRGWWVGKNKEREL